MQYTSRDMSANDSGVGFEENLLRDINLKVIGYNQRHKNITIPLEQFLPEEFPDELDLPMVRQKPIPFLILTS